MEVLQWEMDIPSEKQKAFETFYQGTMVPTWKKFGADWCELLKVIKKKSGDTDILLQERYIERLYLKEGVTSQSFFEAVKADATAWEVSRQYEKVFGAKNVVLSILEVI